MKWLKTLNCLITEKQVEEEITKPSPEPTPEPTPVIAEEKADSDDDVRDAWDASSSEDEQEKTTEQPAAGTFIDRN